MTEDNTLRDWYAGLAMQEYVKHYLSGIYASWSSKDIAEDSFKLADAMISKRNKENDDEN